MVRGGQSDRYRVCMVRLIRTESLCNEPQRFESPRGARGAATHAALLGLRPAVLAGSGHRRPPLALSVRQGAAVDQPASWWTERARPAPGSPTTQAARDRRSLGPLARRRRARTPQRSEERSEPRDRSRPRAFEASTSGQAQANSITLYKPCTYRSVQPRTTRYAICSVTSSYRSSRRTAPATRPTTDDRPVRRSW